jgi:hypothetical protein
VRRFSFLLYNILRSLAQYRFRAGTAFWLFLAEPLPTAARTSTASYTIFLDRAEVLDVGQTPLAARVVYGALAYSNTSLSLGAHEVTMRINDGGTAYFDYAVFT